MVRLVPTPQDLVEQLLRRLPRLHVGRPERGATTEERILDAALAAFSEHGIRATTMTRIARDAGISREWLYKRFPGRDAVVLAVTHREIARFVDGLALRAYRFDDVEDAVVDGFVYAVEFLRDHPLLQRVLTSETDVISAGLLAGVSPIAGMAVQTAAAYLVALGGVDTDAATFVAETLVRLAASAVFVPQGAFDLHASDQLHRYAAQIVPAILAAAGIPSDA